MGMGWLRRVIHGCCNAWSAVYQSFPLYLASRDIKSRLRREKSSPITMGVYLRIFVRKVDAGSPLRWRGCCPLISL